MVPSQSPSQTATPTCERHVHVDSLKQYVGDGSRSHCVLARDDHEAEGAVTRVNSGYCPEMAEEKKAVGKISDETYELARYVVVIDLQLLHCTILVFICS